MKIAQPGAQAAQRVVEPGCDRNQLGRRRRVQVRPAEPRGALERAVLVEDDALPDQRRPGQEVGEALAVTAVFGEVHHLSTASRDQVLRVAQMPAHDVDEGRVALGGPDGGQMADQPDRSADDPEAQAKPDGGGERAVDDRDGARRAAEQDRLGERAMDRARRSR